MLSQPRIVTRGLVAQYTFDEGSGQVLTDRSGNGNHGQLGLNANAGGDTNDPTWGATGLTFAGDDYVLLPSMPALKPSSMVFVFQTGASAAAVLSASVTNGGYRFGLTAAGLLAMSQTGIGPMVTGVAATNVNAPVCASLTYSESGVVSFWVNKVLDKEQTDDRTIPASAHNIGRRATALEYFDGIMAYFAIYTVALTATEVAQNYRTIKRMMASRGVMLP